ncbi:MAG: hypothetical protein ACLF0G_10725 [Candidatus Brocadiia bacterium]
MRRPLAHGQLPREWAKFAGTTLRSSQEKAPLFAATDTVLDDLSRYLVDVEAGDSLQALPTNPRDVDFGEAVASYVECYRQVVENRGWQLLWKHRRARGTRDPEAKHLEEWIATLLFDAVLRSQVPRDGIDYSLEARAGAGAVDIKLSRGHRDKAFIEIKNADNHNLWRSLRAQLPRYLKPEGVPLGIYVVIAYTDADLRKKKRIRGVVDEVAEEEGLDLRVEVVDAREQRAPSRS